MLRLSNVRWLTENAFGIMKPLITAFATLKVFLIKAKQEKITLQDVGIYS